MKATQRRNKKGQAITVGNAVVLIYTRNRAVRYKVQDGDAQKEVVRCYKTFEVDDRTTGRRILHSFADHADAVKKAEDIAGKLSSGNAEAAAMTNKEASIFGRATELIRDTGVPLEIVAAHFAEAFKIIGSDRIIEAAKLLKRRDPDSLPQKMVPEVVAEMLATKKADGLADRSIQDLRSRLNRFAEAHQTYVASIETSDVQRFLDNLDAAPQTKRNFRTVISSFFAYAEARGFIRKGENPAEATQTVKVKGGDVEIYSPDEFARLLESAPDDFKPCIALAGLGGLRSAEIERLEWADIDLKRGFITVAADKAKTASRRIVPVVPALKSWLSDCVKTSGPVWRGNHEEFYDAQRVTAAGTQVKADPTKRIAAEPPVKWKANGLRHSFASYRLADVKSAAQVSLECGNSAAVVFKHYRELVKPADAKRWFAVKPTRPANVAQMPKAGAA